MSCFPQAELAHNPSISKASQPTIIKPDLRTALSVTRAPGAILPFQGDVHSFAPKLQDLASALYGLPYGSPSSFYQGLPTAQGMDPAALYHSLSHVTVKDLPNTWRNPQPSFSPYDPALASFFYAGGLTPLALADGMRGGRKNATRETTTVLKSWLDEHKKNPYPTKAEKVMLAILAKMTLTQVSTWFANARRRLKKENKMTWSPRNCCGEERDSGDENPEHSFNISPRTHESGLENNRVSPAKDSATSPQLPDLKDGPNMLTSDLPYHQYQQQMLFRQFALLPPHLRTTEALKQVQEQMQLRSRWAASASTEPDVRGSLENYISPAKLPTTSFDKIQQQRRNSVGSPSTSSYERSPSPSHRSLAATWVAPAISDQSTSFRKSASVSESPSDSLKIPGESDSNDRPRTKSTEEPRKVKPSIWSPVSMVGEKSVTSKQNVLNRSSPIDQNTSLLANNSIEDSIKRAVLSNGISPESTPSNRAAFLSEKHKLSPTGSASYHATMHAYWREYQRQFASQGSLQQHGISRMMMPLTLDKNQALANSQLLGQLQRGRNLHPQLLFSNNALSKETAIRRSHDAEVEVTNNDTPMNLSKSSRSPDASLPLDLKEKKAFALKIDPVSASTV